MARETRQGAYESEAGPPRFTYLAALAIGGFAFVFRFLTLSSLPNDQYL